MKSYLTFPLLAAALFLTVPCSQAEDKPGAPSVRPVLAIVVVDNINHGSSTTFDRLDLAFQQVARERKWPMEIRTERLAANTPSHNYELLIFSQPLRSDYGEVTYRGWMILTVQGVKHDFGIVSFRYTMRPFQQMDDALENTFLGAANAAADKIEPILFPKPTSPVGPRQTNLKSYPKSGSAGRMNESSDFGTTTALPLTAPCSQAEDKAGAPSVRPVLVIVVVNNRSSTHPIEYVDDVFQQIAWERKWPVEIRTEEFAANTPSYNYELLIFGGGWMILTVQGVKHDLGILHYNIAADKIERILFPKSTFVDRPASSQLEKLFQ